MTAAPVSDCDAVRAHLRQGDFSLLAPVFAGDGDGPPPIIRLHRTGCFGGHQGELAEALSCAAFLGAVEATEYLLAVGVPVDGGDATGLNALHWAANRGQVATTALLLRHGAALETRNGYGGTVLGAAVWAACHEPKPGHPAVIVRLLDAGADVREAAYPTGRPALDALLARFGATPVS